MIEQLIVIVLIQVSVRTCLADQWSVLKEECFDQHGWSDKEGFPCHEYSTDRCDKAEDYQVNGTSGKQACCSCGGGLKSKIPFVKGHLRQLQQHPTYDGSCRNLNNWRDSDGVGCYFYFPLDNLKTLHNVMREDPSAEKAYSRARSCAQYLDFINKEGKTAADACCACGGGKRFSESFFPKKLQQVPKGCHCCEDACLPGNERCPTCDVSAAQAEEEIKKLNEKHENQMSNLKEKFQKVVLARKKCQNLDEKLEDKVEDLVDKLQDEKNALNDATKAAFDAEEHASAIAQEIKELGTTHRDVGASVIVNAIGEIVPLDEDDIERNNKSITDSEIDAMILKESAALEKTEHVASEAARSAILELQKTLEDHGAHIHNLATQISKMLLTANTELDEHEKVNKLFGLNDFT